MTIEVRQGIDKSGDYDYVEVCEWIEGGRVTRKTVNGFDIPPEMLDPLPTVIYQKIYMTRKEIELRFGKRFAEGLEK